ncbi:MAG: DUF2283 domain-containing protein [Deltaproteobacteria bacterium]|nr:DUF2283 domain-containing protein [Deltaproteobacteria bacterium]
MRATRITYDPDGDILNITFGQPAASTGYQLSDQILLRVDPKTQLASGLTIFNYSRHASASREIPFPGVEEHSDVKPLLLSILGSAPVNQFLSITTGKQGVSATLLSPSLQEAVAG